MSMYIARAMNKAGTAHLADSWHVQPLESSQ